MKFLKSTYLIFLLILTLFSCEKDEPFNDQPPFISNTDLEVFSENFGTEIQRDFLGTITDINGNPLQDVSISIGDSNVNTDNNGVFIIRNATVNTRFAYIKAEKTGFINASRSVVPTTGTNKIKIMMLPENSTGSTSSGTQETISLPNGASVKLSGDYVDGNGAIYSGNLNVIMHYLNPEDENMTLQMPGMLYAADADNEEQLLQTFGMLAIELRGENGEELNIAEGSTAEISAPIPQSLISSAPATIPLWSFDEQYGVWVEEGEAVLENGNYVGTVRHFSFWNYDVPVDLVNYCATFVDGEGNPLANLSVIITSPTIGSSAGSTNEDGEVCGLIPAGESLELAAGIQDTCGLNTLFETSIGPFSTDSSDEFVITDTMLSEVVIETVRGIFVNCDQENVTDGYVKLFYGDVDVIDFVTDGDFEITFYRCNESTDFTLTGIDFTSIQNSDIVNYNFSTPTTDIGYLAACNDFSYDYLYFQVGDYDPVSLVEFPLGVPIPINENAFVCRLSSGIFRTGLNLFGFGGTYGINLDFNNFSDVGVYSGDDGNGDFASPEVFSKLSIYSMVFIDNGILGESVIRNFEGTAEVLTFGEVDEFVEISFSGTIDVYHDQFSNGTFNLVLLDENVPINGFMHLKRDL